MHYPLRYLCRSFFLRSLSVDLSSSLLFSVIPIWNESEPILRPWPFSCFSQAGCLAYHPYRCPDSLALDKIEPDLVPSGSSDMSTTLLTISLSFICSMATQILIVEDDSDTTECLKDCLESLAAVLKPKSMEQGQSQGWVYKGVCLQRGLTPLFPLFHCPYGVLATKP